MGSRKIGGLWVVCDDLDISENLILGRKTASLNLSKTTLTGGTSILSLISTEENEINFLSVCTANKISGDLERKFTFGPSIHFEKPLDIQEVLQDIPNKYRTHINFPNRRVSGIPPASWEILIQRIISVAGIEDSRVEHLYNIISSRDRMKKVPMPEVVAYEHDAVAVSLEVFQGSAIRQQYLSNSPVDTQAPFIQALEKSGAIVLEDHMIDNDLSSFPGIEAIRRSLVGAVEITTESGKLTLLNANRTKIENTLGVDLVYYHHTYNSFTMVQYKRLTGSPTPIYRPDSDKSYALELARMNTFLENTTNEPLNLIEDFRMNKNPFYFKFCKSELKEHWSRMTPGMYIPLELWNNFISSEHAIGPKGGKYIGYDNSQRWLNNSEFVMLVRKGWIGSNGKMSENLNSIIEEKLTSHRSVIYAVHEQRNDRDEYLRDARGRFASEDDFDGI